MHCVEYNEKTEFNNITSELLKNFALVIATTQMFNFTMHIFMKLQKNEFWK